LGGPKIAISISFEASKILSWEKFPVVERSHFSRYLRKRPKFVHAINDVPKWWWLSDLHHTSPNNEKDKLIKKQDCWFWKVLMVFKITMEFVWQMILRWHYQTLISGLSQLGMTWGETSCKGNLTISARTCDTCKGNPKLD
jgi:hypothetical protein